MVIRPTGIHQRADRDHAQRAEHGRRSRRTIGWPIPHSKFWMASARPNTLRPHANSRLIGCMKKPKVDRGPNVSMPIRQPHTTITSGVRQLLAPRAGGELFCRRSHAAPGPLRRRDRRYGKLMHRHGNTNGQVGIWRAGQPCRSGRSFGTIIQGRREASNLRLYICSSRKARVPRPGAPCTIAE